MPQLGWGNGCGVRLHPDCSYRLHRTHAQLSIDPCSPTLQLQNDNTGNAGICSPATAGEPQVRKHGYRYRHVSQQPTGTNQDHCTHCPLQAETPILRNQKHNSRPVPSTTNYACKAQIHPPPPLPLLVMPIKTEARPRVPAGRAVRPSCPSA